MIRVLELGLTNALMAALLAVLAAGLCRLYRRPAFAHGLWLLVLVKLLTPPLVPVPLPWFELGGGSSAAAEPEIALLLENEAALVNEPGMVLEGPAMLPELAVGETDAPAEAGSALPLSGPALLLAIWVGGALLCFVWLARGTRRFHKLLRFARAPDPELQRRVGDLARKLGLSSPPSVWLIPGAVSPMLWALVSRPRLLFPVELIERLKPAQLDTLILHELAHWRRRDHWVRFVEAAVRVLYWWHPAVWWARYELHQAEEQCCDAWVLSALEGEPDAERTYALALLETVALLSHTRLKLPATASGIGQVPQLRRRLTMIMSGTTSRSLSRAGGIALAGFALLLLPLIPVRAQDNTREAAPPRPEPKSIRLRVGDLQPFQIQVVPAQGPKQGSVDEQIEALRRVLQMLEQQKQGNSPAPPKSAANPEEIKRAQDRVKKLEGIVAAKRQELSKAERELHGAHVDLAKLGGSSAALFLQWANPNVRWSVERAGVRLVPSSPDKSPERVYRLEANVPRDSNRTAPTAQTNRPANSQDFNRRLDQLLREIEQLRRDIQGNSSGDSPRRK